MKKAKIVLTLLLIIGFLPINDVKAEDNYFQGEPWYDLVETVNENVEPYHSSFIPYDNLEDAIQNEKSYKTKDEYGSNLVQSLNGSWKFFYAPSVNDRIWSNDGEYWESDNWDEIEVPSNPELIKNDDGTFKYDAPIYTNQLYPFVNLDNVTIQEYPTAPIYNNSVFHYKRTFKVENNYDDKEVFVRLEGVSSAYYLFINGQKIGYAEDSFSAHEFDITPYLNKDENGNISNQENTIALQVYRYSLGSFLENQDMISVSGIFRDVKLVYKDDIEIQDYFITYDLDDEYKNAKVNVDVNLRNFDFNEDVNLNAYIYRNDEVVASYNESLSVKDNKSISINLDVNNIDLWFADTPNLYMFVIELLDKEGNTIEVSAKNFGFREIEVKNINDINTMCINGIPLMIKGVNRHEYSLTEGTALSKDTIVYDLELIKNNNINAIRTSHYPNQSITYEIATELGLYICDEANIESHYGAKENELPSGYPAWNTSVMDRTSAMVERDKNETSIIFWSLGNEATYTKDNKTLDEMYPMDEKYCFYNTSMYILQKDPSRLRLYERDNRINDKREESMVDVYSSQYFSVDEMEKYVANNNTPYIQSEYAHSMGNALGNFQEYMDSFNKYQNSQGGFIWDYCDQSVLMKDTKGVSHRKGQDGSSNTKLLKVGYQRQENNELYSNLNPNSYFGYGGDFGDSINDLDYCGNGLLYADRSMSPKMIEVNKVYQNINFEYIDNVLKIRNDNLNSDTSDIDFMYEIVVDGLDKNSEEFNIDVKPLETQEKEIDIDEDGTLVLLNIYALKDDKIISYEQFVIKDDSSIDSTVSNDLKLQLEETKELIRIYNDTSNIIISKENGNIVEYTIKNQKVLENGPILNYTRAPISNDMTYSFFDNSVSDYAESLENANDNYDLKSIKVENTEGVYTINITGTINKTNNSPCNITYEILADGTMIITNTFKPSTSIKGNIVKIGMEFELDNSYSTVTYFGKGPYSNYIDRNTSSLIDTYKTTVDEMFESKYLRPQENGNHTQTYWASFVDQDGKGVLVEGTGFEFSSLYYHYYDLAAASHPYMLNKTENVIVNINAIQRGLGSAICGPLPLDKYIIQKGVEYSYSYKITPIGY